jgi:imidazolonepropionase-like amidohydrolase/ABC-type multidrug transport system permease subunit
LFWNIAFPLLIMVGLLYVFGGDDPVQRQRVLAGIITINLVAAAFFGISLYMVSLREAGLYRRYRATPLTSLSIVVAHAATASVNILASMVLQLSVARLLFGIRIAGSLPELVVALAVSVFAFLPLGLIVGSIGRDMRIAPVLSNLLFFPMAFLSGATMPLSTMPPALRRIAELLPATYVVEMLQGVIVRGVHLATLWVPALILIATGIIAFGCNALLFRWESDAPLSRRGLALVACGLGGLYLCAFLISPELGQARPAESAVVPAALGVQVFTGATIIDGTGRTLERGRLVVANGRVTGIGSDEGSAVPDGAAVRDLTGMFIIPGLIESNAHLGASGGGAATSAEFIPARVIHDLQVYLALGITSVVSLTDVAEDMFRLRLDVNSGAMRAPRVFVSGRSLTAPGGYPAAIFASVPGLAARATYQVEDADDARAAVRDLAKVKVDIVMLYLEAGRPDRAFPVLSDSALRSAIETAHDLGLTTAVHVDSDRHARLALDAGADGLEHVPPDLSDATSRAMAEKAVTLVPALAAYEGISHAIGQDTFPDPKAVEWVLPTVLDSLSAPEAWFAGLRDDPAFAEVYAERYAAARAACRRAAAAGVTILAGSDAGSTGVFHGLGLIRELELLVDACGLSPHDALRAATSHAADRLGTADVGRLVEGAFADFVVLGTNPLEDISAIRDVRDVYFGGVRLDRGRLFSTNPGRWRPSGLE